MFEFTRRRVNGFPDRVETIALYESHLGRPVRDLGWHEVFALVRSIAINERQARLAAAADVSYPGMSGNDNPLLDWAEAKADELGAG